MRKNFNSVQMLETSEVCNKFSKRFLHKNLVGGTTTIGTGYKQIRRLFKGNAVKPLTAVGTLTSLLCNSVKVVEKLLRHVITRRTSVRRGYLPEKCTHANKESLFASVTWLMRLPRRIQRMLLIMTIPALALILTLITIGESRADTNDINCKTGQQSCGTNCCWSVEGATLKITGGADGSIGYMGYNPWAKYPWAEYRGKITSADISGITNISKYALNGYGLTDITLSNDIKTISTESLESNSFTKIVLPDSVQTIGGENFRSYNQLISVEMPDSVTIIGSIVFSKDPLLTSVKLSDSLESVGDYIFTESPNLKEIIISDTLLAEKVDNWNDDAFGGIAENVVIRCLGDSQKCTTALNKFLPDENGQCAVTYCLNGATVQEATKEQCENAKKYYWSGTSCNNKKNGINCAKNWKQNEDFCNRIRYTPAEAAEVLKDDDTNEVTITFKK